MEGSYRKIWMPLKRVGSHFLSKAEIEGSSPSGRTTMNKSNIREKCSVCNTLLEKVRPGWCYKVYSDDNKHIIVVYGHFSRYEGLHGIFAWLEDESVCFDKPLLCPKGHLGITETREVIPFKQWKIGKE